MRFLLAGRNSQIKLASPRPNAIQNFSGNRQINALRHFKNLYSIEIHRPHDALKNPFAVTKGKFFDWKFLNDSAVAEAADNRASLRDVAAVEAGADYNRDALQDVVAVEEVVAADNNRDALRDVAAVEEAAAADNSDGDVPTLFCRYVRFRSRGREYTCL